MKGQEQEHIGAMWGEASRWLWGRRATKSPTGGPIGLASSGGELGI